MIIRPPYKQALGIATGDIVTTSYDTGPYEVWGIHGPITWVQTLTSLVIWPWPVISLTLFEPNYPPTRKDHRFSYINNIHREDHQWFNDMGNEIFVEKPPRPKPIQMGLFDQPEQAAPLPYTYQPGIDYYTGDGFVFHCPKCGADFNDTKTGYTPPFHNCGSIHPALCIIIMGNPNDKRSAYVRGLNA